MKQLIFAASCCLAIMAQQHGKKEKFDFCGRGSSHECFCLRLTQAVQDEYLERCQATTNHETERRKCAAAMPGHCSIVDQPAPPVDDEQGEGQPAMPDRCTMTCKKHDCLCDDGPRCHIGHSATDHADSAKSQ